ncbi:hypothetical protein Tco_0405100 [Tanacetum coccineum]
MSSRPGSCAQAPSVIERKAGNDKQKDTLLAASGINSETYLIVPHVIDRIVYVLCSPNQAKEPAMLQHTVQGQP